MNTSSAEYALITSVKDLLGSISSLLQTNRRVKRSTESRILKQSFVFFYHYFAGCTTELAKYTTIKGHLESMKVALNQINSSISAVETLVSSLKSFVDEKLTIIENEIR